MLNVLLKEFFCIVNLIGGSLFFSEFCCDEHLLSPIEIRRECLFYLNEFLNFVINKYIEEYFCSFSFDFEVTFGLGEKEKWSTCKSS
jgi:hypothetical protein